MDVGNEPIIQRFMFKKQVSTRVLMNGQEQIVIGSIWEFWFGDDAYKELLEFGIDCGFGERNSLGFGFMNMK
jgi:CRISPR-associated endoribonuclease Cas6